jgi:hypothetical protein
VTNTLLDRDYAQYPGSTCLANGINLLTLQPQGGVITGGGIAFTLALATAVPLGIVHLQNLVGVTSVTISVGGYTATRAAPPDPSYGADEWAALGRALFFVLPPGIVAGTVDFSVGGGAPMIIGSVGACGSFTPPFDLATGSSDTILDLSDIQIVPFGSTFVTQRPVRRRKDCAIPYLPDATQMLAGVAPQADYAAEAQRIALIAGQHLPVAVIPFPDDDVNIERRAVWGLISTQQQFTNQFFGMYSTTFQITQII